MARVRVAGTPLEYFRGRAHRAAPARPPSEPDVLLPDPTPARDIYFAFLSILLEGAPSTTPGVHSLGTHRRFSPGERHGPDAAAHAAGGAGERTAGHHLPGLRMRHRPVIRRLVQKGLPLGCAMTYMLAAPIVNPLVALSTWTAFRGRAPELMTCSRMALGAHHRGDRRTSISRFAMSSILRDRVLAGSAAERRTVRRRVRNAGSQGEALRLEGLVHAMLTAQKDFLDVAVYFVIGVAIASIFKTQVIYRPELQRPCGFGGQPLGVLPGAHGHELVLSLCSTTDAFIIAADGLFPPVAKLAFLVFGPMMDMLCSSTPRC